MRVLRTNLSPGMVLDANAIDRSGRMLIGVEAELNEHLLEVLETAQIPVLYVTDDSFKQHNRAPELPPLSREMSREITGRFRHVDLEQGFAREVFNECIHHARERMAEDVEADE